MTFSAPLLPRRSFLAQAAGFCTASSAGISQIAFAVSEPPAAAFEPIVIPDWVRRVTRMSFLSPGEVEAAAKAGVQVVHTNVVWPYYPLRRDGGNLAPAEAENLRKLVQDCRRLGMRVILGLPPFPSVSLVTAHPDWRVHPDDTGAALKVVPEEGNLGTRIGCNLGPWGDYLIELCAELVADYGLDGFSFDGNYHAALCFCPACKAAYRKDRNRELPAKIDLEDIAYREYLVWRGERHEDHYRRMQRAIKKVNPDAAILSWSANAGRYGHLLSSPRPMSSRANRLFDLPMQEWWLDESNFGGSIAPAFGAAYLRAVAGDGPCSSEVYLMSRGNPYGTDSFPARERLARCMLNLTCGGITADSLGWAGHAESVRIDLQETARRERYLTGTKSLPWAAILVSEQTRQFFAYRDIADRFLPHIYGAFRAATEEHLPVTLINDWDVDEKSLARFDVILLPASAALSDAQVDVLRRYVLGGGGLVATGESSLCDELGRPRAGFALADLFGVSFKGRPKAPQDRPALDDAFWNQRKGTVTVAWDEHALTNDPRLRELVPGKSVHFGGPLVRVGEPEKPEEAFLRMTLEGSTDPSIPAGVARRFGRGRVVYLAAAFDAALWSYSYPYQRRMLVRALEWAARSPAPISVQAPMCVMASHFIQEDKAGRRAIVHLFNGLNTTGGHGLPVMEVPFREEFVPIHGIEVRFHKEPPKRFHAEPGNISVRTRVENGVTIVEMPPVELHTMLVGEY